MKTSQDSYLSEKVSHFEQTLEAAHRLLVVVMDLEASQQTTRAMLLLIRLYISEQLAVWRDNPELLGVIDNSSSSRPPSPTGDPTRLH